MMKKKLKPNKAKIVIIPLPELAAVSVLRIPSPIWFHFKKKGR